MLDKLSIVFYAILQVIYNFTFVPVIILSILFFLNLTVWFLSKKRTNLLKMAYRLLPKINKTKNKVLNYFF